MNSYIRINKQKIQKIKNTKKCKICKVKKTNKYTDVSNIRNICFIFIFGDFLIKETKMKNNKNLIFDLSDKIIFLKKIKNKNTNKKY